MDRLASLFDPPSSRTAVSRLGSRRYGTPAVSSGTSLGEGTQLQSESIVKIVVLGGTGTGKSTNIRCFIDPGMALDLGSHNKYTPTIGVDISSVRIGAKGGNAVYAQFWEVPFQELAAIESYQSAVDIRPDVPRPECSFNIVRDAFHNAHGVIIISELSSPESLAAVDVCLDVTLASWRHITGPLALVVWEKGRGRGQGDGVGLSVGESDLRVYAAAAGFTHFQWVSGDSPDGSNSIVSTMADCVYACITWHPEFGVASSAPMTPGGVAIRSPRKSPPSDKKGLPLQDPTGTPKPIRSSRKGYAADGSPIGAPSLQAWLESVGVKPGNAESFIVSAPVAEFQPKLTRSSTSSARTQAASVTAPLKSGLWSVNSNVGVDDLVPQAGDDVLRQVTLASTGVLSSRAARVLPCVTFSGRQPASPAPGKPLPVVTLDAISKAFAPPQRSSTPMPVTELSVSTGSGPTCLLPSLPFPQPLVTPSLTPAVYDDDGAAVDGTEDQVLEHRFETGLKTLSSWVDAFFREGDSLLEALTSAATGKVLLRGNMSRLWASHKSIVSDELREFSELAQVTFRDLLRLDQLRLDIAADADVWLQTLHAEAGRADFRIATAL